jgi:hypothetical protein
VPFEKKIKYTPTIVLKNGPLRCSGINHLFQLNQSWEIDKIINKTKKVVVNQYSSSNKQFPVKIFPKHNKYAKPAEELK